MRLSQRVQNEMEPRQAETVNKWPRLWHGSVDRPEAWTDHTTDGGLQEEWDRQRRVGGFIALLKGRAAVVEGRERITISYKFSSRREDLWHFGHSPASLTSRMLLVWGGSVPHSWRSCSPQHAHTFSDTATVAKPTARGSVGTGRVSPKPLCGVGSAR